MWDDPRALRRLSRTLAGIAFLLLAYGLLHKAAHLPRFALREAVVEGDAGHLRPEALRAALAKVPGNFFTVDAQQARRAVEALPWVRKVEVHRQWPDRLRIRIEEHVAFARWNESSLVSVQGEVFDATTADPLPRLSGPDGAAREVMQGYENFRRLLAPIRRAPVAVALSERRAWRVRLDDGVVLELGRDKVEARLARFVSVYDATVARIDRPVDYADLRYGNGFAVRQPELAKSAETVGRKKIRG